MLDKYILTLPIAVMQKTGKIIATAFTGLLLLNGCATDGSGTKQLLGTVLGAAAGGWAGSQIGDGDGQIVATAAGTLIGAVIGNEVGRNMDEMDRIRMGAAQQQAYAAPMGQTIIWNNQKTGNSGTVTPIRDGRREDGKYCREFQTEVMVGGTQSSAFGVACRASNGDWRIFK